MQFYWGRSDGAGYEGEHFRYFSPHRIIIDPTVHDSDRAIFETVMHESQHHDREGHRHFNRYTLHECHDYALPGYSNPRSGGEAETIEITPNDALQCDTFEEGTTYCAELTIQVPKCWKGTITLTIPGHATVTMQNIDQDCDGMVSFTVCQLPYLVWLDFCW